MADKIKVLVADDNEIMRQIICDALSDAKDIEVVGEASDGKKTVELILETKPDVVLLDLVMPMCDGITVMERASAMYEPNETKPEYIVISAAGREEIVNEVLSRGASYFFLKPFDGDALIKRIKILHDSRRLEGNGENDRIFRLLRKLGVMQNMTGFKFLQDAIAYVVEHKDEIYSITKDVYPAVAEKHQTSAANVERNIRYVIENTWSNANTFLKNFFDSNKKPTNSRFIVSCAHWIANE